MGGSPVQIRTSTGAVMSVRLRELLDNIVILQREHDQLIPLVVDGPEHLRSLRLRQLKSVAQRLVAAQAEQVRISGSFARLH